MKLSNKPGDILTHLSYVDWMASEIKKTIVVKPPTTEQQASTQATLNRDPSLDYDHINRLVGPMPDGWMAVPNAKTDDERVGMRSLNPIEISHAEAIRRRPKNSLGQSEKRGVSEVKIDRATQAFVYTPPAKVTKKEVEDRAVNLVQYKSQPIKEVWVEMNWYQALIHKLRGNKIVSEIKDK